MSPCSIESDDFEYVEIDGELYKLLGTSKNGETIYYIDNNSDNKRALHSQKNCVTSFYNYDDINDKFPEYFL